ncbi:MAG: FAD-binding oxidoreductase, partial [Pirellula sp.]
MAIEWISGSLKKRKVWSDGLFSLTVDCPGVAPFEPGQFLQVGLQLADKHLHRPYSIASPHGQELEFFIVRVDQGELTPRLWNLEVGQSIDVCSKATGSFTLSHTPVAKNLWLLATGTGLAPYIAMLRQPKIWETYNRIVLVHGVRYLTDLAYT